MSGEDQSVECILKVVRANSKRNQYPKQELDTFDKEEKILKAIGANHFEGSINVSITFQVSHGCFRPSEEKTKLR